MSTSSAGPLALASNRRLSARTACRAPASVVLTSGTVLDVQMWDLGTDGASMTSPKPITQGSVVELRFDLPVASGPVGVAAKAKVVYSSYMAPANFRVGVMFTDLDTASESAIDRFRAPSR